MSNIRGLTKFVSDLRFCESEEQVEKRVSTELAKIRSKFAAGKISGYDLKKYVWKLIYIFMMGFDVDFGHIEAVQLLTMPKYSEKNAGHIAVTLMLNENNDVLRLTIQAIKKDLATGTDEVQCLALSTIANIGGEEFAESLSGDVLKLLISK
jgi:AP-2 complex subunit alpha